MKLKCIWLIGRPYVSLYKQAVWVSKVSATLTLPYWVSDYGGLLWRVVIANKYTCIRG